MSDTPATVEDHVDDELGREVPPPAEPASAPGSAWEAARAAHKEQLRKQQERAPLYIDIGEDGIVMRCKWVRLTELERPMKGIAQLRSTTEQALFASIDTLILACDELMVRLPDGITALAGPGEPPVRFDHTLCDGMKWPREDTAGAPMTARKIVHRLFGGQDGEYAILDAAQEVTAWVKSAGGGAAQDFSDG